MASPFHGYRIFPKTGTRRGNCGSGLRAFSSAASVAATARSNWQINWLLLI